MKTNLFYNHVTDLDYAYLDDQLGLVGNSYSVGVEFVGTVDEEGILYDFSHAKKKVKGIIDRDCDHRLIVPQGRAEFLEEEIFMKHIFGRRQLTYRAPKQAVCSIPSSHVNKENIQSFLEQKILQEMPKNIVAVKIFLFSEHLEHGQSVFHYTHGLKQHYGNCQRLFHGHRNTLKVKVNGETRNDLERWLAKDVFKGNTHFCFFENVMNKKEIKKAAGSSSLEGILTELPVVHIEYVSGQGKFEAMLPGDHVYFLQNESTVENLSLHFASLIKSKVGPSDRVEAWAFEGIGKGAYTCLS